MVPSQMTLYLKKQRRSIIWPNFHSCSMILLDAVCFPLKKSRHFFSLLITIERGQIEYYQAYVRL